MITISRTWNIKVDLQDLERIAKAFAPNGQWKSSPKGRNRTFRHGRTLSIVFWVKSRNARLRGDLAEQSGEELKRLLRSRAKKRP
jgi:hypothetical protein